MNRILKSSLTKSRMISCIQTIEKQNLLRGMKYDEGNNTW